MAVQHRNPDLKLSGVSVKVAGHKVVSKKIGAVCPPTGRELHGDVRRGAVIPVASISETSA